MLWYKLRVKRLGGFKFRRQHPIDRFILDFYCHQVKLGIELDGKIHRQQLKQDNIRTQWLNDFGIKIIRFKNQEVINNLEGVLERILKACQERIE